MNVQWANLGQIPEAIGFAIANVTKNNLDFRIYSYPTARIMRAENGNGAALCYLPVHTGIILESLGWAQNLKAGQKAAAGIATLEEIERQSFAAGYREVIFLSSDRRTDKFCQRWLGYERVNAMRKCL